MISEQVRRYAEDPAPNNPNLPPEMIVLDERFSIFFGVPAAVTLVGRLRLQDETVARAVGDVRAIVSDRGHHNARWSVGTSATPSDLVERLLAVGLRREDRAGSEAQLTVMATETPVERRKPAGIEAPQGPHVRGVRRSRRDRARRVRIGTGRVGVASERAEALGARAERQGCAGLPRIPGR